MDRHSRRVAGFGQVSLDDPAAVELVDRFHDAGFRGLGEMEFPQKNYDPELLAGLRESREVWHDDPFPCEHCEPPASEIPTDISSDRMRVTRLDLIARRFPELTAIGARLGNSDYAWAGEIACWNPNVVFDVSGSNPIKRENDYSFFKSVFWWSGVARPHSPASSDSAFEKLVFASDWFGGDLGEFDLSLARYQKILTACGVPAPAHILSGTGGEF